MTYRSKKILQAAKDAPRCMSCLEDNDGTVVMAHSNQQRDGKGTGHKAHDYRVAAMCLRCHALVDSSGLTRAEKVEIWDAAHRETIGWLFDSGVVS